MKKKAHSPFQFKSTTKLWPHCQPLLKLPDAQQFIFSLFRKAVSAKKNYAEGLSTPSGVTSEKKTRSLPLIAEEGEKSLAFQRSWPSKSEQFNNQWKLTRVDQLIHRLRQQNVSDKKDTKNNSTSDNSQQTPSSRSRRKQSNHLICHRQKRVDCSINEVEHTLHTVSESNNSEKEQQQQTEYDSGPESPIEEENFLEDGIEHFHEFERLIRLISNELEPSLLHTTEYNQHSTDNPANNLRFPRQIKQGRFIHRCLLCSKSFSSAR